ncbi:MAG: PAS domain S-box protein [Candidatus Dormibacteraeota bacterium]|nr:PAS domain S-box protein [Candidatus Dormibacteraeota bacterium]
MTGGVVQIAPTFDEVEPTGAPERRSTDQRQLLLAAMLVASSDDAIIGEDPQSVITTWNPAAQRLYGYSAEEVVGRNIAFLLPPDRINELDAVVGRVAKGAGAQHYETKRVHKDGHLIEVGMTVSPIRDQSGAIVGTSTIQRDITQRKQTDAVIVEMAAIVDSSNDAIIGKTLEGVITTWNRGAQNIYGYTADEMIGKSISLIVPPDRPGEVAEIIAGMMVADARTKNFETQRVCKDGRIIDVSLTVSPIRDSDGTIVGASSVARDVTEHNAMAAALKASELRSLLAVSRAKDEMVSLVSHELRTPLASLLGFTELLYSRDFSEEQRRQYLEVMLREGRRLTDLINDVLHIQRLEAGHQNLDLAPADLNALIRRAVTSAGEDIQRPIEVDLPETLPLVMVDTDAVLQVLGNFMSNARKYSPDGGAILVTSQVVGDMVEICVQDHGLGVPLADLPKLFATFYRVDSGDRRVIKGTGLGLSINRRIVEAHGGQVAAYSEGPGHGSRFQFTLPTVRIGPEEADVLIVEDDTGFARLLQEQFVARGMTTVRTADAETAERLLREGMKPRAVVADLVLPGVQGEEFVTRLGADGATVPVLVLTVKNLAPAEISALEKAGVTAVLPKEAGASQAAVSLITEALVPKAKSI